MTRYKIPKGSVPWNKGKKGVYSSETLSKMRMKKLGTKWSNSHRARMAEVKKNKSATRWIEDRTKIKGRHERNYHDADYKDWRKKVWLRDNFKCKISNKDCSGRIEAHHILPWRDYPELRYEVNNGITLCKFHHPIKRSEVERLSPYFQNLINL